MAMKPLFLEIHLPADFQFDRTLELKFCLDQKQNSGSLKASDATRLKTFNQLLNDSIDEFKTLRRYRTAETYSCALNSFNKFTGGKPVPFESINSDLIKRYEAHLKSQRLSLNTISFYLRILRAVYNKAVSHYGIADTHPFRQVYTGISTTSKRSLSLDNIKAISHYHPENENECFARDMFMFSFYTRGMAFVDMAYLRSENLHNGHLTYQRHKTGQKLTIMWEPCMQRIVDRYHSAAGSPYLLPLIGKQNGKERNQYRHKQTMVNIWLKQIADSIGLQSNLTMYVARHSWASIAKEMGAPLDIISKSLGHASEKTTLVYIKTLNQDKINKVNSEIINVLK